MILVRQLFQEARYSRAVEVMLAIPKSDLKSKRSKQNYYWYLLLGHLAVGDFDSARDSLKQYLEISGRSQEDLKALDLSPKFKQLLSSL